MTDWPQIFVTLPPSTRVRVAEDHPPSDCYLPGFEGIVLTHSKDGCTLVAFDAPLRSEANKTKPADAWWAQTDKLEVLP